MEADERAALFKAIAVKDTGTISPGELLCTLRQLGQDDSLLVDLFLRLDTNADGKISPEEFTAGLPFLASKVSLRSVKPTLVENSEMEGNEATAQGLLAPKLKSLEDAFKLFDRDKDGVISLHELEVMRRVIADSGGPAPTEQFIKEVVTSLDTNADGKLEFSDFCQVLVRCDQALNMAPPKEKGGEKGKKGKKGKK